MLLEYTLFKAILAKVPLVIVQLVDVIVGQAKLESIFTFPIEFIEIAFPLGDTM
jgi:hypothetical protein